MNPSPSSPVVRVHSPLSLACLPDHSHSLSDWQGAASLLAAAVLVVGIVWNTEPRLPVFQREADVSRGFVLPEPSPKDPEIRNSENEPTDQNHYSDQGKVAPPVAPQPLSEFILPTLVPLDGSDSASPKPGPQLSEGGLEPAPRPFTSLNLQSAAGLGTTPWPIKYPAEALARREEGSVQLQLVVGAAGGAPDGIDVIQSSGSRYLDSAARDWILANWRFEPGRAGTYRVAFTYQLPVGPR
jgi:protein TonB